MTEPYKCSFRSLTQDDIFREILKSLEIISSQLGELKTGARLLHSDCAYPSALRRCGIFDKKKGEC